MTDLFDKLLRVFDVVAEKAPHARNELIEIRNIWGALFTSIDPTRLSQRTPRHRLAEPPTVATGKPPERSGGAPPPPPAKPQGRPRLYSTDQMERMLDAHAAGDTYGVTSQKSGMPKSAIGTYVARARKAGDPRARRRKQKTGPESRWSPEDKNRMLDLHHTGLKPKEIQERTGMPAGSIAAYVFAARKAGDPRAAYRRQPR